MRKILCLFVAILSASAMAQDDVPFNGILSDLAGKPIRRAHVWVRTPRDYAMTDGEGRFGLTNVRPTDTLNIDIKKRRYRIPVAGRRSMRLQLADETNFKAEEDSLLTDIGFGFVNRREYTGTSNYISGEELRRSGFNDVLSALQGRVPGLNVVGTSGRGGESQQVSMRGTRSIMADQTPLYMVDRTVVHDFSGINLNDIDYVQILKEASVYGSKGANGAIIVHTKMAR
ncbi:MAG: TonB-dependent receptor plug domain-containing protein [Prevotella sp.]|nr:TonB-dependent receptor plug domain-containing protein [Prevotella sp.]MDY4038087.1 TonB-dependent receptor plug domain-containing protein [Prevotella sp.]